MLLQNVRVSGLPTLILYWRGKPVAMHSGVITEEELEDFLDKNLFFQNYTFHIFIRGCEVEFYNEQDLKIKNADGKNGKR